MNSEFLMRVELVVVTGLSERWLETPGNQVGFALEASILYKTIEQELPGWWTVEIWGEWCTQHGLSVPLPYILP